MRSSQFSHKAQYPKTQKELQDLLKKLSLADFEITDEDEHEIQGTICEIDDRGPQYRYITVIKPGNS